MWRASMRRRARLTWSWPLLPRRSRTSYNGGDTGAARTTDDWIDVPLPQMAWQQGGCARILALSTLLRPIVGVPQSPRCTRGLWSGRPVR